MIRYGCQAALLIHLTLSEDLGLQGSEITDASALWFLFAFLAFAGALLTTGGVPVGVRPIWELFVRVKAPDGKCCWYKQDQRMKSGCCWAQNRRVQPRYGDDRSDRSYGSQRGDDFDGIISPTEPSGNPQFNQFVSGVTDIT